MNPPEQQPWRSSLVVRVALLSSLCISSLILVIGFLLHRANTGEILGSYAQRLQQQGDLAEVTTQSFVGTVTNDIRYLSQLPAVDHLLEEFEASSRPAREEDVTRSFQALLEGKPAYYQVRLIGLADNGREIVRLDHRAGRIEVTPRDQLQQKGSRDYFQATLSLRDGEYYLSPIDLNREFGRISEPHTPTLRASALIRNPSGEPFGMLVINVDARHLFREIRRLTDPGVQLYLANAAGDYLMHPDPGKTFGFDLGRRYRLFEDFPGAQAALDGRENAAPGGSAEPRHFRQFALAPGEDETLLVAAAYPAQGILAGLERNRNRSLALSLALVLLATGLIALVSKLVIRRLQQITAAIAAYRPGEALGELPVSSGDEVGVLARKFCEMAEKISEQVQGLEAARREAEAATEAKEAFLANMSHEIRTPLNAILGMTGALQEAALPAAEASHLQTLQASAQHLLALVNDVLDFARIRAGQARLEEIVFSPAEVFSAVCASYRSEAGAKGLDLRWRIDPGVPAAVRSDPTRFSQILNNLVGNGVKYTESGFVEAVLACPEQAEHSAWLEVRVADSGPGIDPAEREQIFRRFHRAAASHPSRPQGTGLGLTITRELVELFSGTIGLESRPGEGAVFTVRLPVLPAGREDLPVAGAARPPRLAGRRLLYIEDVLSNVQVMEIRLARTGAELQSASTGAEGLALLEREHFDGVLLDLQLPDADGWDVARSIRERWPALPVVAVTAQTSPETQRRCQEAGIVAHVAKPLEPERLHPVLERLFGPPPASLTSAEAAAPVLDPSRLEEAFDHDAAKLTRVYATLTTEFHNHREELATAFRDHDGERLHRTAHKMRNALLQLGLEPLQELLKQLEEPGLPSAERGTLQDRALAWTDAALTGLQDLRHRRTPVPADPR